MTRSPLCRVLVCDSVDTASLATWFVFGKLIGVATLVDFGEKWCRENFRWATNANTFRDRKRGNPNPMECVL